VQHWKALHGPAPEVMFPLAYQPGEIGFCDFTLLKRVAITLRGEPFPHFCSSTTWLCRRKTCCCLVPAVWGKTHTAIAIAMAMAMAAQDQACRFFPATTLVQLLQKLDRNALLVIDVISYVGTPEKQFAGAA
jgi:hypothetical protein